MFLTLILVSCLIVPKKVVVNITYFSNIMSTRAILLTLNNVSNDVNMNVLSRRFNILSYNTFREVLVDFSVFFISYINKIEI